MLKHMILFAAVGGVVLVLASAGLAGTIYGDDFNTPQDYTASLAGTIWEGLKLTGGGGGGGSIVACETTSNPGCLTFASSNTDSSDSALLYLTVPADTDFEATVKMVDGNWVPYTMGFVTWHSAGLTAALDVDDWVANYYFSHPEWSATFIGRSFDDGVENNLNTNTGDPTKNIDDYPYTKLAREGNDFIRYYSPDGATWTEYSRHTRDDLAGVYLEVGLRHAMYSGNTASAIFDDFMINIVPEPATLALLGLGGIGLLIRRKKR